MMQAIHKFVVVCILLVSGSATGLAADVAEPKAEPASLAAPAQKDDLSNCAFITNDCEVCTLDASGKAVCSTPGIACVPTSRSCLIRKK